MMRLVSHPFFDLCSFLNSYEIGTQEPGKIYFVLEFCKGGDLSMFLHKRKGRIPESTAKHFMLQLGIV